MGAKAKKELKPKPKITDGTMKATDAKNHFGELLDFARSRPLTIEKNGRSVAVVISAEEFERLETMEDAFWARQAEEATKEGFLGTEASEKFLAEMMNAKG